MAFIKMHRQNYDKVSLKIFGNSLIVGLLSGLCATIYRWGLVQAEIFRHYLLETNHLGNIFLIFFPMTIILSFIISYLIKWAPHAAGSGVPQALADYNGKIDTPIYSTITSNFFGGILNAILGYSVGRQGPSVQMGSLCGKLIGKHSSPTNCQILIAAGASAAITASFNAPIAGVIFVELLFFHSFNHPGILMCFISNLVAYSLSHLILDWPPSLPFNHGVPFSWKLLLTIIILAIMSNIAGYIFQKARHFSRQDMQVFSLPIWRKILIVSSIVVSIGFFIPQIQGGGHPLVLHLATHPLPIKTLLILWASKFILTLLCFNAGVQGGGFFPLLTLGALTGAIAYHLLSILNLGMIDLQLCILLGIAGMLAAVLQIPLFSITIILEMTGKLVFIFPITITSLMTYTIAKCFKQTPFFSQLYRENYD